MIVAPSLYPARLKIQDLGSQASGSSLSRFLATPPEDPPQVQIELPPKWAKCHACNAFRTCVQETRGGQY